MAVDELMHADAVDGEPAALMRGVPCGEREIAAKARGKPRKGLTTKKPLGWKKRARPADEDR